MSPMSDGAAWTPIPDSEQYWSPFDAAYAFTPSHAKEPEGITRPGITEPAGAVTFSLAPITHTESEALFCAGAQALNAEVLRAFVQVVPQGERLVVLDWQHPSNWFDPHLCATSGGTLVGTSRGPWPVTPFPDGDYHVFLSEDLRTGTFGYPWEQTLCVFGEALIDALVPTLSSWLPILRRQPAGHRP